jgi:DNA-binding NtrC family response regulator
MQKVVKSTHRVLVVFKDHSRAEVLKNLLDPFGCTVDVANEGLEALRLIHERPPYRLLVTDLIVDEISGFGLHMLAKKKNTLIKTIALNTGGDVLRNVAEQFCIEQVMDLPVDMQVLCRVARAILDGECNNTGKHVHELKEEQGNEVEQLCFNRTNRFL